MILLLLCSSTYEVFGQRDSTEIFKSGEGVFRTYCSPCHGVHKEKIGPMLASVTKKRSEEWLLSFIRNSQEVLLSGDEYANFLYEQYQRTAMPSFEQLPETKIKDVLQYIEKESIHPSVEVPPEPEIDETQANRNVLRGKTLFEEQCATCHFIGKDGQAPSLGSVPKRRPLPWLTDFIKNSQQVIKSGDDYAVNLFNNYDQKVMPPFEFLTKDDITTILDYVEFASASPSTVGGVNGRKVQQETPTPIPSSVKTENETKDEDANVVPFKITFVVVLAISAVIIGFILVRIFRYLKKS